MEIVPLKCLCSPSPFPCLPSPQITALAFDKDKPTSPPVFNVSFWSAPSGFSQSHCDNDLISLGDEDSDISDKYYRSVLPAYFVGTEDNESQGMSHPLISEQIPLTQPGVIWNIWTWINDTSMYQPQITSVVPSSDWQIEDSFAAYSASVSPAEIDCEITGCACRIMSKSAMKCFPHQFLLDSSALLHFTSHLADFAEYTPGGNLGVVHTMSKGNPLNIAG